MDRAGGERGATAVTYAVMIAIVAVLLVGGIFMLGSSIEDALFGGAECVANPGECEGGSGTPGGGNNGGGNNGGGTTTSTGPTTTSPTTTSTTIGS